MFQLKLDDWPAPADAYTAADVGGRRAQLADLAAAPLPSLDQAVSWTTARAIDGIAWFASASGLCRVYQSLAWLGALPGGHRVGDALSLRDPGLGLDPAGWSTVWFKGGSEPGVLDLAFRAVDRRGRAVVVAVSLSDPGGAVDEATVAGPLLDAVRGA